MIVHISSGHTGRKVAFDGLDKAALWLGCFGLLAWRYVPFLMRPRVDGKEH